MAKMAFLYFPYNSAKSDVMIYGYIVLFNIINPEYQRFLSLLSHVILSQELYCKHQTIDKLINI